MDRRSYNITILTTSCLTVLLSIAFIWGVDLYKAILIDQQSERKIIYDREAIELVCKTVIQNMRP